MVSRRAGTRLAGVGVVAASGLALSALYQFTGLGIACPFLQLTGWECPLCGGTRMGAALLRGDVAAAWYLNPVALVGLGVLAVLSLVWFAQWRGVRGPGVPRRWRAALRSVPDAVWTTLWLGGAVVWTLARNLQ
ncbi:Protein of unknown function [Auraticoccus monumenti]|uniref:DUF2752 domain-containing protein n=1 Tax=Auraticoccus monumenti TaxID=675864 RepID=A0A1G7CJI7_9ACTN|nr:Protein of unknown function [Auraticoccus monumenti]